MGPRKEQGNRSRAVTLTGGTNLAWEEDIPELDSLSLGAVREGLDRGGVAKPQLPFNQLESLEKLHRLGVLKPSVGR